MNLDGKETLGFHLNDVDRDALATIAKRVAAMQEKSMPGLLSPMSATELIRVALRFTAANMPDPGQNDPTPTTRRRAPRARARTTK